MSIGITPFNYDDTVEDLFKRADIALKARVDAKPCVGKYRRNNPKNEGHSTPGR